MKIMGLGTAEIKNWNPKRGKKLSILQTLNCGFQISQQTLNHQVSKKLKIRKQNKENITKKS